MRFAIITHVMHGCDKDTYFAYGPYVREMNIWIKFADKVVVVAPLSSEHKTRIALNYDHPNVIFKKINAFNFKNPLAIIKSVLFLPRLFFTIYKVMRQADHIHLRCPGNVGLIGCLVQICFPKKPKTAKYAGNWDPKARQPVSYKLQKWILSNTFLTRNMQVLIYGHWQGSSKNIKPFFTASYRESEATPVLDRTLSGKIHFLFVGTLAIGKQPLYAVKLVENLFEKGYNVSLDLYGEGAERDQLSEYIAEHNLTQFISIKGNHTAETIKIAYQHSHFLILPSRSEGWPKVIAEAMFWGCLPIASKVSCVPDMLGDGERGVLLEMEIDKDVAQIASLIGNSDSYQSKVGQAVKWSRKYTLDLFENEISALLIK